MAARECEWCGGWIWDGVVCEECGMRLCVACYRERGCVPQPWVGPFATHAARERMRRVAASEAAQQQAL